MARPCKVYDEFATQFMSKANISELDLYVESICLE